MDFITLLFASIIGLAVLQAVIPTVVQLLDAILLFIVKAPFRWLARRWQVRAQQTPYQRGLRRATEGAFLLASSGYAALWLPAFIGRSLGDLAGDFWRAPADHLGVAAFFAVVTLSSIWLVAGMRAAARGGDRDWLVGFWSAALAGFCLAALWQHWLPPWPVQAYATLFVVAIKGLYIAAASAALVRFVLSVPLPGGSAERKIKRLLKARNAALVPVRQRRFFFF